MLNYSCTPASHIKQPTILSGALPTDGSNPLQLSKQHLHTAICKWSCCSIIIKNLLDFQKDIAICSEIFYWLLSLSAKQSVQWECAAVRRWSLRLQLKPDNITIAIKDFHNHCNTPSQQFSSVHMHSSLIQTHSDQKWPYKSIKMPQCELETHSIMLTTLDVCVCVSVYYVREWCSETTHSHWLSVCVLHRLMWH